MLRRLLVGLNGSEHSQAAMRMAIALAQTNRAELVGAGIVDVPHLTAPEPVPLGAGEFKERRDAALLQKAHETVDEILAAFSEYCRAAGLVFDCRKLIGDPVEILVQQAQRCDLLIVGKRHLPEHEWERAGHTLDQLLRHTPRPVVCVPATRTDGLDVLVAYDASLQAARALQAFVESGIGTERTTHVAALGEEAQEHAALAAGYLGVHGLTPHLHIEGPTSDPARRLLDIAAEIEAGLIVLGCYGQPLLKEFFFGSVTKGILSETTVPLFLYH